MQHITAITVTIDRKHLWRARYALDRAIELKIILPSWCETLCCCTSTQIRYRHKLWWVSSCRFRYSPGKYGWHWGCTRMLLKTRNLNFDICLFAALVKKCRKLLDKIVENQEEWYILALSVHSVAPVYIWHWRYMVKGHCIFDVHMHKDNIDAVLEIGWDLRPVTSVYKVSKSIEDWEGRGFTRKIVASFLTSNSTLF